MGVFATRSPNRPNPIGLSVVKLEKIDGTDLYVSGIDMVDNTPIYDIKPYLPHIDAIPDALGGFAVEENGDRLNVAILVRHIKPQGRMGANTDSPMPDLT